MQTGIRTKWIYAYTQAANMGSDCGYVAVKEWTNGYIDPVGILSHMAMIEGIISSVRIKSVSITPYGYRLLTEVNHTAAHMYDVPPWRLIAIQDWSASKPWSVVIRMIQEDGFLPTGHR